MVELDGAVARMFLRLRQSVLRWKDLCPLGKRQKKQPSVNVDLKVSSSSLVIPLATVSLYLLRNALMSSLLGIFGEGVYLGVSGGEDRRVWEEVIFLENMFATRINWERSVDSQPDGMMLRCRMSF